LRYNFKEKEMNHTSRSMKIIFIGVLLTVTMISHSQNNEIVVLKNFTEIVIDNNKLTRKISHEILINNRLADSYGSIYIDYSKLKKINRLKAWIEDLKGNEIKRLKDSEIESHSAIADISLYDDNMVKKFTLKHNVYPYILKYTYEESENQFLDIDYWNPAIYKDVPVQSAELKIKVPLDYKIRYKSKGIQNPTLDTLDNHCVYVWKSVFKPIPESETYSPEISDSMPYVRVVPLKFKYKNQGSFESWKSYGDWQYNSFKDLQELPPAEIAIFRKLIAAKTDSIDILKTLYHYLQDHTRYVNVSIKTGGMIPYPASYVSENKYGDCKGLSNYFLTVFKAIGFRPIYTKVYAGNVIKKIDKSFPSQQSNHVILCIPMKKDTIWLDCTSDGPFNYLGTFSQGRDALLIEKNNIRFVTTPKLKPEDVCTERSIVLRQKENQNSIVEFRNIFRGNKFDRLLSMQENNNTNDQALIIRNEFVDDGFEMQDYKIVKNNRDSLNIGLNYTTTTKSIFSLYGNDMILKTIPFKLPAFEKPALRKYDVQLDTPICKTDVQQFIVNDLYKVATLPENRSIKSEYGLYTASWISNDSILTLTKRLIINPGYYRLSTYSDFYKFISAIADYEKNNVIELIQK